MTKRIVSFHRFAKATKNAKNRLKHVKYLKDFVGGARGNFDSIIYDIVNQNVTKTNSEICTTLD